MLICAQIVHMQAKLGITDVWLGTTDIWMRCSQGPRFVVFCSIYFLQVQFRECDRHVIGTSHQCWTLPTALADRRVCVRPCSTGLVEQSNQTWETYLKKMFDVFLTFRLKNGMYEVSMVA